jgi:very-short-patch-repair endonuclease
MSRNSRVFPAVRDRARELRHPQTAAEATLWRALRARSLGYKFRRQHPIDRFIVDFYCAHARLCIEIDGGSHFEPEQQAHDAARTEYLEGQGYQVLRFTNDEVRYNPDAVASAIIRTIEQRLTPSP